MTKATRLARRSARGAGVLAEASEGKSSQAARPKGSSRLVAAMAVAAVAVAAVAVAAVAVAAVAVAVASRQAAPRSARSRERETRRWTKTRSSRCGRRR